MRRRPSGVILGGLTTLTCLIVSASCGHTVTARAANRVTEHTPVRLDRSVAADTDADADADANLQTFGSKAALKKYLDELAVARRARTTGALGGPGEVPLDWMEGDAGAAPPTSSAAPSAEPTEATAASPDDDGITNVQEQGVDEGGIVKTHGDHLVVLRRGRLFTVKIGDQSLTPVAAADVRPGPGHDAWYDEMLVHDDTIIVIGFSYQAGATEIGVFDIDDRGGIVRRDTFFLKSNDYYSSRNYASRLLDDKLVFYMPYWLSGASDTVALPGMTRYDGDEQYDDWNEFITASTIYRPIQNTPDPVLHTVVTCDLGKSRGQRGTGPMQCHAQGIIGPAGRSFYVSKQAVYVWAHAGWWSWPGGENPDGHRSPAANPNAPAPAAVYRLPLDGQAKVGALRTWGAPVDQFSFKESDDGHLNVVVRAESPGDWMWGPEISSSEGFQQDTALMRVPLDAFARGVATATHDAYTDLPEPTGNAWSFHNRFVGDHLLYGTGFGWGAATPEGARDQAVFVHRYTDTERRTTTQVPLPHAVERIEALGNDAVIVGSDGADLHFTSLDLGTTPTVAGRYVQPGAAQGETRSHGFFFRPSGDEAGTLGLAIRGGAAPGYEHLVHGSASLLFLSVDRLRLRPVGALASDPQTPQNDRCEVSCVDWYGNARPIFYRGRTFALLGYELVEGKLAGGSMHELGRANMLSALGEAQPVQVAK